MSEKVGYETADQHPVIKQIQKAIEKEYKGPQAVKRLNHAINAGTEKAANNLRNDFKKFEDKGYSKDEIVSTPARLQNGVRKTKIGWNGPHDRWRLIHLNEFGYHKNGKRFTPRGFGAIDKSTKTSETEVFKTIYKDLEGNI